MRIATFALLLGFDSSALAVSVSTKDQQNAKANHLAPDQASSQSNSKQITWYEDMDNVIGPQLLQRLPSPHYTPNGVIPRNGPAAEDLGVAKSKEACLDACLTRFKDKCHSVTFYSGTPGYQAGCYAVTTSYYDWFPAHDPLKEKNVTSARVWHGCKSEADCAANGECNDNGSCECASGWKGPSCSELDLLPTIGDEAGYKLTTESRQVSSWGGAPHQDEKGLYHMWVSHMRKHCGILAWTTNSVILHATSKYRLGPYLPAVEGDVEKSVVFDVFSHEPDVKRGPHGEWIMFMTSYTPKSGEVCDCLNGTTPSTCPSSAADYTPQTRMSWSQSPYGPWSKPVKVLPNIGVDMNLSPIILPDGSLVSLLRGFQNAQDTLGIPYGVSKVTMAVASNWKDPSTYELHNDRDLFLGSPLLGPTEDPWLYQAPDGRVHALFHNMYGCFACCGHAFADKLFDEGNSSLKAYERFTQFNWTYTGADACGPFVQQTSGGTTVLGRRERPHMLLDSQRRPLMLTSAVTVCPTDVPNQKGYCPTPTDRDRSWTMTQPIRVV